MSLQIVIDTAGFDPEDPKIKAAIENAKAHVEQMLAGHACCFTTPVVVKITTESPKAYCSPEVLERLRLPAEMRVPLGVRLRPSDRVVRVGGRQIGRRLTIKDAIRGRR